MTDRDIVWLQALHRHGPLPWPYLHELTKHMPGCSNFAASRHRVTQLFHELQLFYEPPQQFDAEHDLSNFRVVHLTENGEDVLKDLGLWRERVPSINGAHWWHDFAAACVCASIEIAVKEAGGTYHFHDEILDHNGVDLPLDVGYVEDGKNIGLTPDRLGGFTLPNGKSRFFALEIDKATEQQRRTKRQRRGVVRNRKTTERNACQYKKLISEKRYKQLGIPGGFIVLNVTKGPTRMENMMRVWQDEIGETITYGMFKYLDFYSSPLSIPPVMRNIFTDPWQRVGAGAYKIGEE